jgi:two-component sensor histidine kinase
MSAGLGSQGISVFRQSSDSRFALIENPPSAWPENAIGRMPADILPAATARLFDQALSDCLSSSQAQLFHFILDPPDRQVFEARVCPDEDGVLIVLRDVTSERSRDAALRALLREVSHRSKNLLAIVQSVAMQSAVHAKGVDDFLGKFRGRLHALSGAQDLVTDNDWQGTQLHALIANQLARLGSSAMTRTRVTGANPLLVPNAALHLGLAIHELAINALVHGGMEAGGNVWIDAQVVEEAGKQPTLEFRWRESGPHAGDQNGEARFGTLVLDRIAPMSVGGTADFSITPEAVDYRLTIPADQFEV